MARTLRASVGGYCYHVINRGNRKAKVFFDRRDYEHFQDLLAKACARLPLRIIAYCLMPNHFHLVVWPFKDGDLSSWMQWLLTAHVRRYHARYRTDGRVWQGRFKSFPIQQDRHLLTVLRYVERNPLRAGLIESARDWRWSSFWGRTRDRRPSFLVDGPFPLPADWASWVQEPHSAAELNALRANVNREIPYGDEDWTMTSASRLGLVSNLRGRGRPRVNITPESK
jgi:putative transposase